MSEHTFTDPTDGEERVLVMAKNATPYDGTHGVKHEGCDRLADVSPDLDCWSCRDCQAGGRISGAWFMELWTAADA